MVMINDDDDDDDDDDGAGDCDISAAVIFLLTQGS